MRQVGILGALLAAALIATYATWFDDGSSAPREGVAVVTAHAATLSGVRWEAKDQQVDLTRTEDDAGAWIAVEVRRYDVPDAKADDTDAEDSPPAEPTLRDVVHFVGNDSAQDVWDAVAPLVALRDLGPAEGEALAEFGLDAPEATLTITHQGGESVVEIGGESFGTRDRYARLDGRVLLLDDKTLRPLQFASTRLMERAVQPFAEGELATVEVRDPANGAITLTQRNADDRAKAFWSSPSTGEGRDTTASTWIGKLLRTRLTAYPSDDEVPDDRTPAFAVTLTDREGTAWDVTVSRSTADGKPRWFAESAWLRSLVELTDTMAEDAAADVPTLFEVRTAEMQDEDEDGDDNAPAPDLDEAPAHDHP